MIEPTTAHSLNLSAPDLTRHPPRSARVHLGGFAILARCLDKGRATIAGTNGEYHFACPLDQQFLNFAGIDVDMLRTQLAAGRSDGEILEWVIANARHRHTAEEIAAWSATQAQRGPDEGSRAYFEGEKARLAPRRHDITSWFDLLDVDDFATFGGKA